MAPPPPPLDRTETLSPRTSKSDEVPPVVKPAVVGLVDDPERYEQIGEHARGGLGRVVRAVDKRLGRTVAVKELLRRNDEANEARFMREALITARLEHPGIVPVHEAGRWPNGDPYYVMKLVEGRTLKELIAEHKVLRDRLGLLPHVIAIADAVGYAHSEGVIHRDLKPSNVIVGEFGETIVVDWGLARDRKSLVPEPQGGDGEGIARAGSVSTVSGKVIGTPAYMAPEQARGELVDERADVYAIGAVLYEVLSGVAPHADTTPQATLDRVLAGPPRPIGDVIASVPRELATIVGKAMARNPDGRYPNATALAEDLRRFQTGKLVRAHSYTALSRIRKKVAQHRGVAVVAVASLVALGGVGVESFRRVVAERNIARTERLRTEEALTSTEQRKRELVLLQAETSLRKDPTAALAWLKLSISSSVAAGTPINDEDRAKVVDLVDEAVALGVSRHVFRTGDWVFDAVFTPDGQTLIAAVRDGTLRAYDLRSGVETTLGRTPAPAEMIVLTPDGESAITSSPMGDVNLWPLRGGAPRKLTSIGQMITNLKMSADGQRLRVDSEAGSPQIISLYDMVDPVPCGPKTSLHIAVADNDWSKQVVMTAWNQIAAVDGDKQVVLGQIDRAIAYLALSPRGDLVVIHDGATLWTVPFAGGPIKSVAKYDGKVVGIEWSPDQKTLAVIGNRPDILLVDPATGAIRELRGHSDALYNAQWTRDGRRLLTGSDDGTARVWTIADGSSIALRGHDDDVYRARFSHDERQVATASLDGTVRVWSIEQAGQRVLAEGGEVETLTIEHDRVLVKTPSTVSRWDLATGARTPLFSWAQDPHSLGVGVASPDGNVLLVPGVDWSLEVRKHDDPKTIFLRGHRQQISHVEFSRDSKLLYSASYDGTLRRWDLATGASTLLVDGSSPVRGFAVSRDGRVAVQVGDAVSMVAADGTIRLLGKGSKWCTMYAQFDLIRDRLIMHRCDRGISIVDGDNVIELPTDGYQASRISVSPDGARMVGAMTDRTVRVWETGSGKLLHVLRGHSDLVMDVAFSPDGTQVASSSYDKTVRIWQLATEQHRVLRGHSGAVGRVAWYSATELVTGSRDGTLRIWTVPALTLPTAAELGTRLGAATTARIAADRPASGTL